MQLLLHRLLEHDVPALPAALAGTLCRIAQQTLGVVRLGWRADAGGNDDVIAIERQRYLNTSMTCCDLLCVGRVRNTSSRIANSSPPRRATVSDSRGHDEASRRCLEQSITGAWRANR
jgi:hypothetical protein